MQKYFFKTFALLSVVAILTFGAGVVKAVTPEVYSVAPPGGVVDGPNIPVTINGNNFVMNTANLNVPNPNGAYNGARIRFTGVGNNGNQFVLPALGGGFPPGVGSNVSTLLGSVPMSSFPFAQVIQIKVCNPPYTVNPPPPAPPTNYCVETPFSIDNPGPTTNPKLSITEVLPATAPLPANPTSLFNLTVRGTGFVKDSPLYIGTWITFNGTIVYATVTSSSQLTAKIPINLQTVGEKIVKVVNPAPGGGESAESVTFTFTAATTGPTGNTGASGTGTGTNTGTTGSTGPSSGSSSNSSGTINFFPSESLVPPTSGSSGAGSANTGANPATKLVFIGSGISTNSVAPGVISNIIIVQRQNASSNLPNVSSSLTISLSSTSSNGRFYAASGNQPLTNSNTATITMPAGWHSQVFRYSDTTLGTATITASTAGLTSATKNIEVTANATSNTATGFSVTDVQGILIGAGYDIPAITIGNAPFGIFGSQTMSALSKFEIDKGLNSNSKYLGVYPLGPWAEDMIAQAKVDIFTGAIGNNALFSIPINTTLQTQATPITADSITQRIQEIQQEIQQLLKAESTSPLTTITTPPPATINPITNTTTAPPTTTNQTSTQDTTTTTTSNNTTPPAPNNNPAPPPLLSPPLLPITGNPDALVFGNLSEGIKSLQQFLIEKGFLETGLNTGFYGNLTENALCDYQKSKGLSPTSLFCGKYGGSWTNAMIESDGGL